MGYTNYIRQKRDFTDDEWRQITDEYNYIKEFKRIVLAVTTHSSKSDSTSG